MLTTMLRSVKDLYGYDVCATDSKIGRIKEFYLNVGEWRFSLMEVDAGESFGYRTILLSSEILEEVDQESLFLQRSLEEIRKGALDAGAGEKDLKPVRALLGFTVHACDGVIGRVEDLIVNDADLAVRYLVISAPSLGKKFVVSPWWAEKIDWKSGDIRLSATANEVFQSPEYKFRVPVSREYENQLHDHYRKQPYWANRTEPKKKRDKPMMKKIAILMLLVFWAAAGASAQAADMSSNQKELTLEQVNAAISDDFDQKVTETVRTSMKNDPALRASLANVQMKTVRGEVYLKGTVPSEKEKTAIGEKARLCTGVTQIHNYIQTA